MIIQEESFELLRFIVDRINVGVFVVDKDMNIAVWNQFMEVSSGISSSDLIGNNLFAKFPELPKNWLEKKIKNVFFLKNYAFTSWEQRAYLFKFPHNRPVTGGIDSMQQNCTFIPVKNTLDEVKFVCVTIFDVTDTSIYQRKLMDANHKLDEASNRDGLTEIFNRRYLEQTLLREFGRSKRYDSPLAFILLDLDHFKRINDLHGHLAGDEVLKKAASILSSCVREADTVGRYGGEEFAVVLPQTGIEGAMTLAQRLRYEIANTEFVFNDSILPVTVSIGVSEVKESVPKYEALIHEADTALYVSKRNGRNQVSCYSPSMEKK